jgi:GNAT superfamily N-acetyltransferase
MNKIRTSNIETDASAVWAIIEPVIKAGDTYVFDPETPRAEMLDWWFADGHHCYAAEDESGEVLGIFWLKANQPGLGDHVCNAAYMVSPKAHGKGIGRQMGEYSLDEARRLGFTALQFNFVVASNTAAVRLWRSIGMAIIGTIPNAFRHKQNGPTDAFIMYREL